MCNQLKRHVGFATEHTYVLQLMNKYITWVLTPEQLKNYNQTFQRY